MSVVSTGESKYSRSLPVVSRLVLKQSLCFGNPTPGSTHCDRQLLVQSRAEISGPQSILFLFRSSPHKQSDLAVKNEN